MDAPMKMIIYVVVGLLLLYELMIKDAFGFRTVVVNHFFGFDNKIYGAAVSMLLPYVLLMFFKDTHVYTSRNLDNLLIMLSIFVSVLFGIMGDLSGNKMDDDEAESLRQLTLTNAIFVATQCIFSMILTFGLMNAYVSDSDIDNVFKLVNLVNFYMVFSILINTLLILKRFARLIRDR